MKPTIMSSWGLARVFGPGKKSDIRMLQQKNSLLFHGVQLLRRGKEVI